MPKKPAASAPSSPVQLEEQAMLIASEIFNLMDQYTHDSNISKFFLTDEIAKASFGLAGGFASVLYTPVLEPEETQNSAILSLVYALITYGFNIYLREHSLTTNSAPYKLPTDPLVVKKLQKKTLERTSEGSLISTRLADTIIAIIAKNVQTHLDMAEFSMKGHKLNKTKFNAYVKLSLYWGYNFARELLTEKTIKKKRRR